MTWRQLLHERLQALGHRNWIVVSDAAYPLQVAPGLEMFLTGEALPKVLQFVLAELRESTHLRPIVWLDEELDYISEDAAPGIQELRHHFDELFLMEELETYRALHTDLLDRVRRAAEQYRVLVLKTTTALPYTSVFLELDCAYWDADREESLRRKMAEQGR